MLLKDKLKGHRLILASASPRRRQILTDAGLPFVMAEPYEVDEIYPADLPAAEVAEFLATLKSDAYPVPLADRDIILTADTTVVVGGVNGEVDEVLGKPRDRAESIEMLEKLSGRAHKVITGVTIRTPDRRETFAAESTVTFRHLTREEIEYYVDTFSPMDKAGAYAIQEWIGYIGIERIEGSFHNVMGLPIQMIYSYLNRLSDYYGAR
ncbi:MAG: Maf family nucleotide pyrophosphatase [Alistipes sp.]|jgi:septum formation protein|nr:Maf family nucleotide pyrophosphatase [Alistipes sp.]